MKTETKVLLLIIASAVILTLNTDEKAPKRRKNAMDDFLIFQNFNRKMNPEFRKNFLQEVRALADRVGIDPNWLMFVMRYESGISASIKNKKSNAVGLIQFMPKTLQGEFNMTTDQMAALNEIQQLKYVEKYLTKYGYHKRVKDPGTLYFSIYYPLALYRGDGFTLPKWVSDANPVFNVADVSKDGLISKREFINHINQKFENDLKIERNRSKK